MEFSKSAYAFAGKHSKVIFVTVVFTAFFSDVKNFFFELSNGTLSSQLNLAVLALARSILALLILFFTQQVFMAKPRRVYFSSDNTYRDLVIEAITAVIVFWSPIRVLNSVLVLAVFGIPFSILLFAVQKLVEHLQGTYVEERRPAFTPFGLRTRSGMHVLPSVEYELRRMRDESMKRRSASCSPARKVTRSLSRRHESAERRSATSSPARKTTPRSIRKRDQCSLVQSRPSRRTTPRSIWSSTNKKKTA